MLDDRDPGGGREERRPGGEVERAGTVATGPDHVNRLRGVDPRDRWRDVAWREANPRTSSGVSPFARNAISRAPAIAGSTSPPVRVTSNSSAAAADRSCRRADRRATVSWHLPRQVEEIAEEEVAVRGQDTLRMELDPLHRVLAMPDTHDHPIRGE